MSVVLDVTVTVTAANPNNRAGIDYKRTFRMTRHEFDRLVQQAQQDHIGIEYVAVPAKLERSAAEVMALVAVGLAR